MKTKLILSLTVLILITAACGGQPTQSTPEPAAPTQAMPEPTAVPTQASTATEAVAPATETTEATQPAAEAPMAGVSFANDVKPILSNSCFNCHGGDQTRAGLDLKTYESLMAGSKNGAVIVPGNSAESLLIQLVTEGKMPKRGDKLTPEQVQLINDWVAAGASNN